MSLAEVVVTQEGQGEVLEGGVRGGGALGLAGEHTRP